MANNDYLNVYYYEKNAAKKVENFIRRYKPNNYDVVILCIGMNNSNGASLGSIVGSILKDKGVLNVYGTLDKIIDGENIIKSLFKIRLKYKDPFIIAVSSDLGNYDDIDSIIVKNEALSCELLRSFKVGNLSIRGIVNKLDYEYLSQMEKVDLCSVYYMAKTIAQGIKQAMTSL